MTNYTNIFENYRLIDSNMDFAENNYFPDNYQPNKSINNIISINTEKIPNNETTIFKKAFTDSLDQDCSESQSNLSIYLKPSTSNKKDCKNKYSISTEEKNLNHKKAINNNNKFIVSKSSYKEDKKIFSIKKKKKLGRIKKNSNKKGKHNKFKRDNIIRRFKVHLMKNISDYINSSFTINKRFKKHKQIKFLKKLSCYDTKLISKKDNINWLNSSVKSIFSQKISNKISCFESDYNKELINTIYKDKKEIKIINILNKTISEMWLVYINDDDDEWFKGFTKLKDDIIKLRENGETENYINLFINIAHKFEEIFNKITPRKKS